MGMFGDKSAEGMSNKLDYLDIKDEVVTKEAEIAEKEAVIAQLKKQYGRDWMRTLGISKLTDIQTLRSFLSGAKVGMRGMSQSFTNSKAAGVDLDRLRKGADISHLRRL